MGREVSVKLMEANHIINVLMHVYGMGIDDIIELVDRVECREYDDNPVIFIAPGKCSVCQQHTDYNIWMLLNPKESLGNTNVDICGDCLSVLVVNLIMDEDVEDVDFDEFDE